VAKPLTVDYDLLEMAFADRDGHGEWFLDLETGEVLRRNELELDDELPSIDDNPDRYTSIPYQGSEAGYRDMAEFADSVTNNRLRALLDVALDGAGAFRRFKDVLLQYPDERTRWFAFQKERARHRIERWLESEGIQAIVEN
jgi:hypothetical protein